MQEDSDGKRKKSSKKATNGKIKSKSVVKRVSLVKGMGKDSKSNKETSKRKRETSLIDQLSEVEPSPKRYLEDQAAYK